MGTPVSQTPLSHHCQSGGGKTPSLMGRGLNDAIRQPNKTLFVKSIKPLFHGL